MPSHRSSSRRPLKPTPRPISNQEQLERELAEVQAQYRGLVEHAVEGVFRTTPDGRFLMANAALATMLGYDDVPQLLAARTDLEQGHYVKPGERGRFRQLLEMQGLVQGFEYEAYRRDGTTVWLRDNVRAVRDPSGRTLCYEGTVEDITSRKQAERMLDFRARQQAAVARFGAAAMAGDKVPDLLDCATTLVAETLEVPFTQILELAADRTLTRGSGTGWKDGPRGPRIPIDRHSQAGWTVTSGEPVIIGDLTAESRFRPPSYLLDHHVISGVTVIIGAAERPYGVLSAYACERRVFTADDVNFMQSVANLVSAAIERHRSDQVRRHLLARAISAQEDERQRVSRELHDETGQALSALLVGLRRMEDSATLEDTQRLARELRHLTGETVRNLGRIARDLRPPLLDDLGLVPAIRRYADELSTARGITIAVSDGGIGPLSPVMTITIYRILQEALTNVARHSQASRAIVAISPTNSGIQVSIRDDGRGFTPHESRGDSRQPLGLVGMRERAALIGGTVTIASGIGKGTTITVDLPLQTGIG